MCGGGGVRHNEKWVSGVVGRCSIFRRVQPCASEAMMDSAIQPRQPAPRSENENGIVCLSLLCPLRLALPSSCEYTIIKTIYYLLKSARLAAQIFLTSPIHLYKHFHFHFQFQFQFQFRWTLKLEKRLLTPS